MVGNVKIKSLGAPYYNPGAPSLNGWFSDAVTGVSSAVSTWFTGKSKEDTAAIYSAALTKQYEQEKALTDIIKYGLIAAAVFFGVKALK